MPPTSDAAVATQVDDRRSPVGRMVISVICRLIAGALVLTPGLLLHLGGYHLASAVWMLVGTTLVFAFQHRTSWNVNWSSTLVPAVAVSAAYLVIRDETPRLVPLFSGAGPLISTWGALLAGALVGLVWGSAKRLAARGGGVRASGLVFPILVWGATLFVLAMSMTLVELPAEVSFYSFVSLQVATGLLAMIFVTLFFRRYLFNGGWQRLALVPATVCLVLGGAGSSPAQGFSQSERQAFLEQEIPSVMKHIMEWLRQQNWPAEPAGLPGALNHNSPRMNVPNALGYQFSIRMAYRPGAQEEPSPTVRALLLKYRSASEAAATARANVDDIRAEYSANARLYNVRVEQLDVSQDSVSISANYDLPSGAQTGHSTIVYSHGPYFVRMQQATAGGESKFRRHLALAQAVRHAIGQVSGGQGFGGGSSSAGKSFQGSSYPGMAKVPEREVAQTTGLVSIVILGSTVLTAFGSALFGGIAPGTKP